MFGEDHIRKSLGVVCGIFCVMTLVGCQPRSKEAILQRLKGLGHGAYLFGQVATWVHKENPNMDDPSNWLKKVYDHTGVMPAYGCLTYDFNKAFTDMQRNEGVKQMWDRGLLVGVYTFWVNPCGGHPTAPVKIEPIFAPASNPVKDNFYQQMDRMAANLQWLKERRIVVVYTPFVELDDPNKWHAKEGGEKRHPALSAGP